MDSLGRRPSLKLGASYIPNRSAEQLGLWRAESFRLSQPIGVLPSSSLCDGQLMGAEPSCIGGHKRQAACCHITNRIFLVRPIDTVRNHRVLSWRLVF